ncbi:MAG: hypothetical protein R3E53_03845 [Myxococcota bacterium]
MAATPASTCASRRVAARRAAAIRDDPTAVRESDHYQAEYVQSFTEKWDELIDWNSRAESEGRFFIEQS